MKDRDWASFHRKSLHTTCGISYIHPSRLEDTAAEFIAEWLPQPIEDLHIADKKSVGPRVSKAMQYGLPCADDGIATLVVVYRELLHDSLVLLVRRFKVGGQPNCRTLRSSTRTSGIERGYKLLNVRRG